MQVTDPVCGMKIEDTKAAGKSNYKGRDYFFCANACKTKFDKSPEQYVKSAQ